MLPFLYFINLWITYYFTRVRLFLDFLHISKIGPLIFSNPHNVNKDFCMCQQENDAQQQHSRGFEKLVNPILEIFRKCRKNLTNWNLLEKKISDFWILISTLWLNLGSMDETGSQWPDFHGLCGGTNSLTSHFLSILNFHIHHSENLVTVIS